MVGVVGRTKEGISTYFWPKKNMNGSFVLTSLIQRTIFGLFVTNYCKPLVGQTRVDSVSCDSETWQASLYKPSGTSRISSESYIFPALPASCWVEAKNRFRWFQTSSEFSLISMAKSENSKSNFIHPSAKVHPSNDPDSDSNSYSLEKFKLYETRAVSKFFSWFRQNVGKNLRECL